MYVLVEFMRQSSSGRGNVASAALSVPVVGHRLRGAARSVVRVVKSAVVKAATPHRAALANLKDIPLTVLGIASVDFAAFHYIHMIGWLVTGVSLVVLEHLIADES